MNPIKSHERPPSSPSPGELPIDIHIGTEKTGSTSIQRYLEINRDALLKTHGVLFPQSLGIRASSHLAAACQLGERPDDLRLSRGLLEPKDINTYSAELSRTFSRELGEKKPTRILLTSEHFSSRLQSREEIARLRHFLQPFASHIRILIYLRRQDKMLLSAYSTAVKNGRTTPFSYPPEGKERHDCHYDRLLNDWADVFGEDSIVVRLYEHERLNRTDLIQDFCHTLELPDDLNRPEQDGNRSFTTDILNFIREFNKRVPKRVNGKLNPLRGNFVRALEELDFSGESLDGNDKNSDFYQRFKAGNLAVAKRWFSQDDSVPAELFSGIPKDVPSPEEGPLGYDQLLDACAQLWTFSQRELRTIRMDRECNMAELHLERGQLQEAREKLESLHRDFPDLPRPQLLKAKLALRSDNPIEAVKIARRATALDPDNPEIRRFIEYAITLVST